MERRWESKMGLGRNGNKLRFAEIYGYDGQRTQAVAETNTANIKLLVSYTVTRASPHISHSVPCNREKRRAGRTSRLRIQHCKFTFNYSQLLPITAPPQPGYEHFPLRDFAGGHVDQSSSG